MPKGLTNFNLRSENQVLCDFNESKVRVFIQQLFFLYLRGDHFENLARRFRFLERNRENKWEFLR